MRCYSGRLNCSPLTATILALRASYAGTLRLWFSPVISLASLRVVRPEDERGMPSLISSLRADRTVIHRMCSMSSGRVRMVPPLSVVMRALYRIMRAMGTLMPARITRVIAGMTSSSMSRSVMTASRSTSIL